MAEIRSVVNQVLSQLGTSREARYYLKQYSEDDLQFAVIKIGGAVLEEQLRPLASALAFLSNLGLMPIILHGVGPQLDLALKEADIETVKRRGLRVTTPDVMEVARPVIYRANRRLVSALEDEGVRAIGIQHGVFVCDYLDREELGLVGEIQRIDLEAIRDAIRRGVLPVVLAARDRGVPEVVLPAAKNGLLGAVLLGVGRGFGETMAVLMATGSTSTAVALLERSWVPRLVSSMIPPSTTRGPIP